MTISVLIACYNAQKTLLDTLTSLVTQTRQADEIIVVDDGSTDQSAEVASRFSDRGVTVIKQANAGASAARNRAFAVSKGDRVIFVDADDLVSPRHLEALESSLGETKRHVAFSRWDRFYKCPDEATFPERHTEVDLPGAEWLLRAWADARPMTQSGMMLIPRVLLQELGGWDERLSLIDDFEFFARILSRSDGLRFAREAKLYYRSGLPVSLSQRRGRSAIESQLLSLELGTNHLLAVRNDEKARTVCANLLQDFDFSHYPNYPDLRLRARARVVELGGSDLQPDGPPGFQRLRPLLGWKLARHVQRAAERFGLNGAARQNA